MASPCIAASHYHETTVKFLSNRRFFIFMEFAPNEGASKTCNLG